jgi:thiamine transporter ThiT
MRIPLRQFFHKDVSLRALQVALIVGTILGLINHYDLLLGRQFSLKELIQIALTYIVPYLVSAHGQLLMITGKTGRDLQS